jgi:tetratricopeptide (TPR) repeat protein
VTNGTERLLIEKILKLADAHAEEGGGDTAIALWRKALAADPGNLYALYRLAKAHRALGDVKSARVYEKQLQHFEPRSVAIPLDFRLAEYQGRAMAALVDDGLWERATLRNVVSGQVKQFADGVPGLMTERVLQTLLERWPQDPDLLSRQAELERRGELGSESALRLWHAPRSDQDGPGGARVAEARRPHHQPRVRDRPASPDARPFDLSTGGFWRIIYAATESSAKLAGAFAR